MKTVRRICGVRRCRKTLIRSFDFLRLLVSLMGKKGKGFFFPGVVLDLKENFEDFVVS